MLNGMLWILRRIARTGVPWEDLPARYGAAGTVSSRLYRRREAGVSDRVLQRLQAQADARGAVDWDPRCADATVVRPPVRRRGTPVQRHRGGDGTVEVVGEALARSQGGSSTEKRTANDLATVTLAMTMLRLTGVCGDAPVSCGREDPGASADRRIAGDAVDWTQGRSGQRPLCRPPLDQRLITLSYQT